MTVSLDYYGRNTIVFLKIDIGKVKWTTERSANNWVWHRNIPYLVKWGSLCWTILMKYLIPVIKQIQQVDVINQVLSELLFLKSTNTVKNLIQNNLCSFITWWKKYYSLPIGPGRTLATQFIPHHESDRTWKIRLEQVRTSNEIYQRHKKPTTYPECKRSGILN